MLNHLLALGFVGEYVGAEDTLTHHRPVVEFNGKPHVAMRSDWTIDDLVELGSGDEDRYNTFTEPRAIEVGEVVWVVGATLYNRCQRLMGLDPIADEFARWRIFRGPFSYRFGTPDALVSMSRAWLRDCLKYPFYLSLYSPAYKNRSIGGDYLKTILALPLGPEDKVQMLAGLYYHEMRDEERYALAKMHALIEGSVDSDTAFDAFVSTQAAWLMNDRVFEVAPAPLGDRPIESLTSRIAVMEILARETLEAVRTNRFLNVPRVTDEMIERLLR